MSTIKYPSISQFKNIIRQVQNTVRFLGIDESGEPIYDHFAKLPTLQFTGTVKIHGTNAGIRLNKTGEYVPQSRERDLSLTSDNAGFCVYALAYEDFYRSFLQRFLDHCGADQVVIYGEWAGTGVQKGVAVSELPKAFYIFGIRLVSGEKSIWIEGEDLIATQTIGSKNLDQMHAVQAYLITEFQTWKFEIDFNHPEDIQNEFVRIVEQVEAECPVGKHFGVSGIGEGIVVSYRDDKFGLLQFKCKGEKHSNSKVKAVAPVDELAFKQARDFAENYTTDARLEQGIQVLTSEHLLDMTDTKNLGAFLKWVSTDIFKEEGQSIIENGLDNKKVSKAIQDIAKKWYFGRAK